MWAAVPTSRDSGLRAAGDHYREHREQENQPPGSFQMKAHSVFLSLIAYVRNLDRPNCRVTPAKASRTLSRQDSRSHVASFSMWYRNSC